MTQESPETTNLRDLKINTNLKRITELHERAHFFELQIRLTYSKESKQKLQDSIERYKAELLLTLKVMSLLLYKFKDLNETTQTSCLSILNNIKKENLGDDINSAIDEIFSQTDTPKDIKKRRS